MLSTENTDASPILANPGRKAYPQPAQMAQKETDSSTRGCQVDARPLRLPWSPRSRPALPSLRGRLGAEGGMAVMPGLVPLLQPPARVAAGVPHFNRELSHSGDGRHRRPGFSAVCLPPLFLIGFIRQSPIFPSRCNTSSTHQRGVFTVTTQGGPAQLTRPLLPLLPGALQ